MLQITTMALELTILDATLSKTCVWSQNYKQWKLAIRAFISYLGLTYKIDTVELTFTCTTKWNKSSYFWSAIPWQIITFFYWNHESPRLVKTSFKDCSKMFGFGGKVNWAAGVVLAVADKSGKHRIVHIHRQCPYEDQLPMFECTLCYASNIGHSNIGHSYRVADVWSAVINFKMVLPKLHSTGNGHAPIDYVVLYLCGISFIATLSQYEVTINFSFNKKTHKFWWKVKPILKDCFALHYK